MKSFEEITYYGDIEEEDGQIYGVGDYHRIELIDIDSKQLIVRYGDHYHDKGIEKLRGFYDGLNYSGIQYNVSFKDAKDEFEEEE